MEKQRHIKTPIEKWGVSSVLKEAKIFVESMKGGMADKEDFNKMPYIAISYIPYVRKAQEDLIYYFENFDLEKGDEAFTKAKIVEVTEENFTLAHYDDHHHQICFRTGKVCDYMLRGNEIVVIGRTFNHFGGEDNGDRQVLKSAAGFYIGSLYKDKTMGGWFPYHRDSEEYWSTREEAEESLKTGTYIGK